MTVLEERRERLEPQPLSARRARRVVLDALAEWSLEDLADAATLLVSEVITNSLLHAGTEMELTVRCQGEGVRIEVRDLSLSLPSPRNYSGDAVTGRGLEILDLTATDWGAERSADGKVVWFELGTVGRGSGDAVGVEAADDEDRLTVRFLGTPVALARATFDYGDALIRDLALLSFSQSAGTTSMQVISPRLRLTEILDALQSASEQALSRADLTVKLPVDSTDGALERLALIDEAHRMAQEGRMLLPASLPEIAHCRRWMMGEIVAQAAGEEPTAWAPLPGGEEVAPTQGLSEQDRALIGEDLAWTVVADEENHIQFIGEEAAALLGWDPAEVIGRRVTTLVPPELREAHLVGFTRYQLTKEPVLMNRPVTVEALCKDGVSVPIALLLQELPATDGRPRYRARLTPRG